MCNLYGKLHMGQFTQDGNFGHFRGIVCKNLNTHCAKTKRGSLVFSTVPEHLGLGHHKNVTVNSIALVKLVHNDGDGGLPGAGRAGGLFKR